MSPRSLALPALVLLAAGCGDSGEPVLRRSAITNGPPSAGDPAVVALIAPAASCGDEDVVFCSGTLVSDRAVVTAAHCIDFAPPGTLQVFFGAEVGAGGRRVEVAAELGHPDYQPLAHDVAVLELRETVTEPPVPLFDGTLDASFAGREVRIVGFGADDFGVRGVKHEGAMTIESVDAELFEASPSPSNSCVGDSGGPVLIDVAGQEVLAGVTSFGDPSCTVSATNTRVDVNRADFLDDAIAAVAAAPAPGPRAPLEAGASLCGTSCDTDADCPAGTACVDGACGLGGLPPGRLTGACETADDCDSNTCAASCECYESCDDCDGCAIAPPGRRGARAAWLLAAAALLLFARRTRSRLSG